MVRRTNNFPPVTKGKPYKAFRPSLGNRNDSACAKDIAGCDVLDISPIHFRPRAETFVDDDQIGFGEDRGAAPVHAAVQRWDRGHLDRREHLAPFPRHIQPMLNPSPVQFLGALENQFSPRGQKQNLPPLAVRRAVDDFFCDDGFAGPATRHEYRRPMAGCHGSAQGFHSGRLVRAEVVGHAVAPADRRSQRSSLF